MSFPEPGQPGPEAAHPDGPGQTPDPSPEPALPGTVRNAFYLIVAGAVLSLLSLVTGPGSRSAMRTAVFNAAPNVTSSQLNTAVDFGYVLFFLAGVLGAGLWVWMAYMNRAGRNWARITGTVLFGLDTIILLSGWSKHTASGASLGFGAAGWLIGLATVVLIWAKASSAHYRPRPQLGTAVR